MTKTSKNFNGTLEDRFNRFLNDLIEAQNIDEMSIFHAHQGIEKADYILNGDIILEIKTLKDDPNYKVEKKLDPHRDREDFPHFYGEMDLTKVLGHLPDGEEIKRDIFFAITKSIQAALEKADGQIGSTKKIIGNPNACGVVAILNEEIEVFEPKVIAYIAQYMMNKRKEDGAIRYKNIGFVYFISEAHYIQVHKDLISMPIMIIDGPNTEQFTEALDKFENYNLEWAAFNKVPILKFEGSPVDLVNNAFRAIQKTSAELQIPRYELWRKEYREKPYLRQLPHNEILEYGREVMKQLATHFQIGHPKKPHEETLKMMIIWTHFLEESNHRGLNLKELQKTS